MRTPTRASQGQLQQPDALGASSWTLWSKGMPALGFCDITAPGEGLMCAAGEEKGSWVAQSTLGKTMLQACLSPGPIPRSGRSVGLPCWFH